MMPFADISDSVIRELIWAVVAIAFGILQLWTRKAITDVAEAEAAKAEEVRKILAASNLSAANKLESITAICTDTHVLVNDRHGKALKLAMDLAQALAEERGTPEARSLAAKTAQEYSEHESKQAIVDSQEAKRND